MAPPDWLRDPLRRAIMAGHAAQDATDEDKTALVRLLYLSAVVTPSKAGAKALGDWMALHGMGAADAGARAQDPEAVWLAASKYWFMADGPAEATGTEATDA